MDIYSYSDVIHLSYSRVRNNALVTGLTVTVVVKNAQTGATLLSSTSCPEVASGAGIYTYNWTHGLNVDTQCQAIYTVGANQYVEYFEITYNSGSSSR